MPICQRKVKGSSLVVQWLGLDSFTVGAWVPSLVRELRFCKWSSTAKKKKKGHNPRCISRVAQMVKNPPAMQETRVQFLDQEDALKEGLATHCSILAWRIPWTEEPGYSPWGHKD